MSSLSVAVLSALRVQARQFLVNDGYDVFRVVGGVGLVGLMLEQQLARARRPFDGELVSVVDEHGGAGQALPRHLLAPGRSAHVEDLDSHPLRLPRRQLPQQLRCLLVALGLKRGEQLDEDLGFRRTQVLGRVLPGRMNSPRPITLGCSEMFQTSGTPGACQS